MADGIIWHRRDGTNVPVGPGERFGRLTVIERAPTLNGRSRWTTRCDCGTDKVIKTSSLVTGNTRSCGCLNRELLLSTICPQPHRLTDAGFISSEYHSWYNMKTRCTNPRAIFYARYGGRGITVCDRWQEFSNFLADMGTSPGRGYGIERIDNDGHYEPGNCRWATAKEQAANRCNSVFVILRGEKMIMAEAARRLGLAKSTIGQRVRLHGITPQEAVDYYAR